MWSEGGQGLMEAVVNGRRFAAQLGCLGQHFIDGHGPLLRIGEKIVADECLFRKYAKSDGAAERRVAHNVGYLTRFSLHDFLFGPGADLEQYQHAAIEVLRGGDDRKREAPCLRLKIRGVQTADTQSSLAVECIHHGIGRAVLSKEGGGKKERKNAKRTNHKYLLGEVTLP